MRDVFLLILSAVAMEAYAGMNPKIVVAVNRLAFYLFAVHLDSNRFDPNQLKSITISTLSRSCRLNPVLIFHLRNPACPTKPYTRNPFLLAGASGWAVAVLAFPIRP